MFYSNNNNNSGSNNTTEYLLLQRACVNTSGVMHVIALRKCSF